MQADKTMRRRQELFGVLFGFGALFFLLGLVSFSPKDPCLFIREGATVPIRNWMGPVGATLSGWLMALFGFSSWLVMAVPAAFAYWSFRGRGGPRLDEPVRLAMRSAGLVLLALSISIFLDLALGRIGMDAEPVRAGGILGRGLGSWLVGLTGSAGAVFLVLLLVVMALMAAIDFSPVQAARFLAEVSSWLRDRGGDYLTRVRQADRRRREVGRERNLLEKMRTQREIRIVVEEKEKTKAAKKDPPRPRQKPLPFLGEDKFELPGPDLLDEVSGSAKAVDQESLLMNARILESKLRDFGVSGEVVEVQPGPVITMYEYKPGPGIKINL